ncbi:NAD(P)-binding protein [Meredithblackwellia eburnea MCA 4105]
MASIKTHHGVGVTKPFGPLETLTEPTPAGPGPRELLVKGLKLGFTPLSLWQVDFGLLVPENGILLGGNLVAEVLEVGKELETEGRVKVGDKIMAFQHSTRPARPAQERVLVSEHSFALIPPNLSLEEAATIPDSFVTAYHSLATELGVPLPTYFPPTSPPANPELSILIWGGGSTCGVFAVQLLKASGYTNVTVTSSPSRFESLKSLGAARAYSYSSPLPSDLTFSVVLDCIGDLELTVNKIAQVGLDKEDARVGILLPVRMGGYGSTTGVDMDIKTKFPEGVTVKGVRTHYWQSNPVLAKILQTEIMYSLFAQGIVKPTPWRAVKGATLLERCEKALDEVRKGTIRGEKLVLDI